MIASLTAALLASVSISPAPATAADPSADIPGVPLPGPVAAGRLGGAIYDVVYRITVPAAHVILASLTGTAGTDFDIYLFDSTATTVLSTTGQLTKSIGPTSSESISWPSRFGGTYYVDLNGATDVEGDYLLTVQTVPDATPPFGSLTIAGGKPSTNLLTVPVTLNGSDDLSTVAEMAFSGDGVTFTDWVPYVHSSTWTFPAGDGPKTLWAKLRNGVGLESAPITAKVAIDTDPPAAIDFNPPPGATIEGLRPNLTVTFDEPIDPSTWTTFGLVVQASTGALVAGQYTYDATTRTGSFIPVAPMEAGSPYIVTVGNVTDVAGNRVISPGSWTVTPLATTTAAAVATPTVVLRGGSSRLDVILGDAPLPATIDVSSASSSSPTFSPMQRLETADGRGSIIVTPALNTTYRFRYEGAPGVAPVQVDVPVYVRRSVVLVGRSSTSIARGRVGTTVKLTAAVGPAAAGVSVSFRVYRFDVARRTWVYAGSRGRNTDSSGRATYTWTPPSAGSWYWRAVVASTPEFANNTSPVYRWSISR
jgi:hypothetical protein